MYICSTSKFCGHTVIQVKSDYIKSLLRIVKRIVELLNSTVRARRYLEFLEYHWTALRRSFCSQLANPFFTLLYVIFVCVLIIVWAPTNADASRFLVEGSSEFAHTTFCTKRNSSALADSFAIIRDRSGNSTSQYPLAIREVADSRTKLFVDVSWLQIGQFHKSAGAAVCTWGVVWCNDYLCLSFWALEQYL